MLSGSSFQGFPPLEWSAERRENSFARRKILPLVRCWERWLVSLERSCLLGDRNWAEERTGTWICKPGASIQDQGPLLGSTFTLLAMTGRCPSCPLTLCLSSGLFSLWSSSSLSLPASSGKTREQSLRSVHSEAFQ